MPWYKPSKRFVKQVGRQMYNATGYKNPIKKGKLSSSRMISNASKLVKDVAVLKSMINAEKKRFEVNLNTPNAIGQVNGNSSGHWLLDFTPNISQGVGYNQKNGNSFKWHSSFLDFQFTQQANTITAMKIKIELVQVIGQAKSTISSVMGEYIEPTSFLSSTVYDIHSPRDPDYFKNFRVLKTKYVTLPVDNIGAQTTLKRVKMGIKYKDHHVRTNNNDPTITNGQVFILITTDSGNCSASTTSTITGIPINGVNTGATFLAEFTHYYYDN